MEITIRLDEETAAKLEAEAARAQRPVEEVVKEKVLRGVDQDAPAERKPFKVRARDLGVKPGIDFSCTSRLLEELDRWKRSDRRRCEHPHLCL